MRKTAKIFLCYAKEDQPQVETLYQKLRDAGFAPWMDKVDLVGGEEWRPAIQKAIREAHFFVACVSKYWIPTNPQDRKRFFRREIQTALDVLPELAQGDIYVIPIRLEECEVPDNLSLFQWIDYFQNDGWDRLLKSIHKGMERLGLIRPLRSKVTTLSRQDVTLMLRERDFYEHHMNNVAKGIKHEYERHGEVVFDATTGLTWQQSGSREKLTYDGAEKYIRERNDQKFAGHSDWRLPTLEEATSLMEPTRKGGVCFIMWFTEGIHLFIDPVFDQEQSEIWTADKSSWIWSADKESASSMWSISFSMGSCVPIEGITHVRAVRSGQ